MAGDALAPVTVDLVEYVPAELEMQTDPTAPQNAAAANNIPSLSMRVRSDPPPTARAPIVQSSSPPAL